MVFGMRGSRFTLKVWSGAKAFSQSVAWYS